MKIDISRFSGECGCGRRHQVQVKGMWIEAGAADILVDMLHTGALSEYKNPTVICDQNTYKAAAEVLAGAFEVCKVLILPSENLHPDNHGVEITEKGLDDQTDLLLAVGTGTIHDITRFIAKKRNLSFISVPTAASVDGFVSTVAAMTWNGLKKTIECIAPDYVIADTRIFKHAPYRLTASGVSDLLGKYTALADWRIAQIVTDEYLCEMVYELEADAVEQVVECMEELKSGSDEAYEKLMYALLLSGLAMQMIGNSRPASGCEHHFSHLWEMEIINDYTPAYHGEKVSVGLLIALEVYADMKKTIQEGSYEIKSYQGLEEQLLRDTFGKKGLFDGIVEENTPDTLAVVVPKVLEEKLPEIVQVLEGLPDVAELREKMDKSGCVTTMEEIHVDKKLVQLSVHLSPYVRNRLTLMRIKRLLYLK